MSEKKELDLMKILYLVLALIMAFIAMRAPAHMNPPVSVGFFTKFLIFIFSFIAAYAGALIGDFVRKMTLHDSIITQGGLIDILKTKFFWFIVPQLVGIVAGGIIGGGIIFQIIR